MATQTADGTVANYTYNAANQLTTTGSRNFTYDNQGNEVTDGTKTLGYNFDNQLTSYTSGSTTTSYAYDATGNRIEKSGPANYQYVNVGNNNVLAAKNVTAGTSTFYVYGNDLVSQGGAAASSRQYYLTDGLGNVKYVTSNTGTVLNTYSYDPWGGNQTLNGSTANSNTYQAEQKDAESNLVYLRARYYDPSTGRFVEQDPMPGTLSDTLAQNGYNYADNNPVNLMDPMGLAAGPIPTTPNAVGGYMHWLTSAGSPEVMNASKITWQFNQTDLQNLGKGSIVNKPLGASASGFNPSEQIGRVSGSFSGTVTKVGNTYRAVGIFTPATDLYNFNMGGGRSVLGNAASIVGNTGGAIAQVGSLGIIEPTTYCIKFTGSVSVNQSW